MHRAAILALGLALSCDDHAIEDPREAEIVNVMAQADEPIIRSRPALSAGKYVKMAGGPYDFFRGTVPLYRTMPTARAAAEVPGSDAWQLRVIARVVF